MTGGSTAPKNRRKGSPRSNKTARRSAARGMQCATKRSPCGARIGWAFCAACPLRRRFLPPCGFFRTGVLRSRASFWRIYPCFSFCLQSASPCTNACTRSFGRRRTGLFRAFLSAFRTPRPIVRAAVPWAGAPIFSARSPLVFLGVLPCVLGLCFCNMFAALFGVCGILCAGGDILISCRAVFCRAVKLLDHPERCGFFAFYKAKE